MADGTVKIDLLFPANKQKFHSDTELVNDLLKKLGDGAGQHMDDEFDKNAKKMTDQSKSTSKKIKDDFKDPVKQKIDGDNKDLDSKVKSSKSKLKGIPKETKTKLLAEAKKAGIDNFGKLLKHLPKKQQTELLAKAQKGEVIDFDDLIKKVPKKYLTEMKLNDNASPGLRNIQEEAQNTSNKFSHLKEIIAGSFLGNALSGAFSAATSGLQSLASEAIQSSDAIFKFKSTMKFGGFGEDEIKSATKEVKKYADDTVYELNDVSNTTAQLAANGIKDYMGLTEAAGNLNAAAGGNADTFKSVAMMLTQTAGAGKLTTENWNQLTDAIPGASGKLQEAMKKNGAYTGNFRDAMAAGQVTSDEFSKAIMQLGQQDGAVKAAKSTQTFEGAVGNMQAEVVSDMDKVIDAFGKKKLTDAIGQVGKLASSSFGLLLKAINWFEGKDVILGTIWSHLKNIAKVFGGEVWKQVSSIFGDLAKAFGVVSDKSDAMKDPLATIDNFLIDISNHKEGIKKAADALMIFFAVKKARDFGKALGGIASNIGGLGKKLIFKTGIDGSGAQKDLTLLGTILKKSGSGVKKALKWSASVATKGAKKTVSGLGTVLKKTGSGVGKALKWTAEIAVKGAQKAMRGLVKTAQITGKGLKAAFAFLKANPLILLVSAIVAVVVALVELYKHNKKFRKFVNGLIDSAKAAFKGVVKWFGNMKDGVVKHVSNLWNGTKKHFSNGWNNVKSLTSKGASAVKNHFNDMKNRATGAAKSLWNTANKDFRNGAKVNQNVTKTMKDVVTGHWGRLGGDVKGIASSLKNAVADHFRGMYNTLNKLTGGGLGKLTSAFSGFGKGVKNVFSSIKDSIQKHVKNGINGAIGFINGGIGGINKVIHTFGGSKNAIGKIKKLAAGGSGYRGIAMVNDGGGEEAIIKGGHAYKVQGKNAYVNLEGDETVVPHGASRAMFGDSIVHYAGGSKNWFSSLTGWFKDKWDGIVNFIKHPLKSLENIMSKAMGAVSGSELVTNLAPALGKGLVRGIEAPFKKMLQKLKDKHDEEDEGSASGPNAKPTGDHKHWMKQAGFKPGDYSAINWIVNHESGWRVNATNGSSGAYGLPQSLPGSKMASAGTDWKTNPITQLKWMKSYVKGRYGSAAAAKRFWEKHNWYENGGFADKPSIFGEKGLEAAVPLSVEKADQGYAMLGKSAAYMAQRDSLNISNGQTNDRLDKVEQGLSQAVLLLNQINTTGKDNVKATYATAIDKKAIYNQMALDQSLANHSMGGA